ncbi:MAG: hypothetical protein ACRCVW_03200 [Brevinema sp.]
MNHFIGRLLENDLFLPNINKKTLTFTYHNKKEGIILTIVDQKMGSQIQSAYKIDLDDTRRNEQINSLKKIRGDLKTLAQKRIRELEEEMNNPYKIVDEKFQSTYGVQLKKDIEENKINSYPLFVREGGTEEFPEGIESLKTYNDRIVLIFLGKRIKFEYISYIDQHNYTFREIRKKENDQEYLLLTFADEYSEAPESIGNETFTWIISSSPEKKTRVISISTISKDQFHQLHKPMVLDEKKNHSGSDTTLSMIESEYEEEEEEEEEEEVIDSEDLEPVEKRKKKKHTKVLEKERFKNDNHMDRNIDKKDTLDRKIENSVPSIPKIPIPPILGIPTGLIPIITIPDHKNKDRDPLTKDQTKNHKIRIEINEKKDTPNPKIFNDDTKIESKNKTPYDIIDSTISSKEKEINDQKNKSKENTNKIIIKDDHKEDIQTTYDITNQKHLYKNKKDKDNVSQENNIEKNISLKQNNTDEISKRSYEKLNKKML